MLEFLREKLWRPIVTGEGYNTFNTAFYALFFVGAVEVYWRLFAREQDQQELRLAAVPFILLGGLLRFADGRWLPHSALLVTPGVYLLVLAAFTLAFRFLGARRTHWAGWALAAASLLPSLPMLNASHLPQVAAALAVAAAVGMVYRELDFMGDTFAWAPHLFEAWVTSFGVMAGLVEEHVLAGALMRGNPLLFGAVKTLLMPVIMRLVWDTEEGQRRYVGTVIGMIGLGPGLRDALELLTLGGG